MASGDMVEVFRSCAAPAASAVEAPSKSFARSSMRKANKANKTLSLEDVHENIIRALKSCTESLLLKIDNNTKSILKMSERLQNLFYEMGEIKMSIETVKKDTADNEERINALEKKMDTHEALQCRWNLRLYGVQEKVGENLKTKVINICSGMAPEIAKTLQSHVDFCHRLGIRKEGNPRPILIRFSSISVKKKIWIAATNSDFLRTRKYRFGYDLTSKEKDMRSILWPQVAAARRDGLKAFFVGAKAIIDGQVVTR